MCETVQSPNRTCNRNPNFNPNREREREREHALELEPESELAPKPEPEHVPEPEPKPHPHLQPHLRDIAVHVVRLNDHDHDIKRERAKEVKEEAPL